MYPIWFYEFFLRYFFNVVVVVKKEKSLQPSGKEAKKHQALKAIHIQTHTLCYWQESKGTKCLICGMGWKMEDEHIKANFALWIERRIIKVNGLEIILTSSSLASSLYPCFISFLSLCIVSFLSSQQINFYLSESRVVWMNI